MALSFVSSFQEKTNFYTHQYIKQVKVFDRKVKKKVDTVQKEIEIIISINNSSSIFSVKRSVYLKFYKCNSLSWRVKLLPSAV